MCGRYLLDIDIENLEVIYEIVNRGSIDANWRVTNPGRSVFPTNQVPVVLQDRMGLMQWGYHLPSVKGPIINCRIESLMEKPFYNEALALRRVVVPASAYFEWRTINGPKAPYTIGMDSGLGLPMAGVYFKEKDGAGWAFALVTTPSCGRIATLHHRMPLLLNPEQLEIWRNRDLKLKPNHIEKWADQGAFEGFLKVTEGIQVAV